MAVTGAGRTLSDTQGTRAPFAPPPGSSRRTQHFSRPSTPVVNGVPAMAFQDGRHIARRIARARNAYQRLSFTQRFVVHIKGVLIAAEPLQYAHEVSRVSVFGTVSIEDPSSFLATQDLRLGDLKTGVVQVLAGRNRALFVG
jgi:hypothetical protein